MAVETTVTGATIITGPRDTRLYGFSIARQCIIAEANGRPLTRIKALGPWRKKLGLKRTAPLAVVLAAFDAYVEDFARNTPEF